MSVLPRIVLVFATLVSLLLTTAAAAAAPPWSANPDPPPASFALQGFSGIFNTPTAHVQAQGSLAALYSNQRDDFNGRMPPWQDNYLFSVGLFNCFEIGGRLTEAPGIVRDLSANVKLSSAPFTAHLPFSPVVAVGIQDIGGGSNNLQSSYLALTGDLWRLRLTAGYGYGPNRMKGAFGGVELQAHEWIQLLGEYDTRDTNAGIRLIAPPLPYLPARLTLTAKTALNHPSRVDLAFGFSMPLNMKSARPKGPRDAAAAAALQPVDSGHGTTATAAVSDAATGSTVALERGSRSAAPVNLPAQLESLRARLIKAGFANVRVGLLNGSGAIVEYENVRFNHNELDAIGVVAGIACSADLEGVEVLSLVVKRKGLRMLHISAPLRAMKNWLADNAAGSALAISVSADTAPAAAARYIDGDSNPDWLRPSLMIYPGLKTFVGTEAGVFDYLLSVKPDLQITTWKGGVLNTRWDLPVAWSSNFNDQQQFAYARNKPWMDRLMLFQGINLAPGLLANLGGGMILHDSYGTLNELTWSPGSGIHRIRLAQAYARSGDNRTTNSVWLGSYRLYLPSLDLFLDGTAGRFWGQDRGVLVSMKRFFGDTAVELYYKNTETPENKRWQAAGIQFSFPLTPRRDMARSPIQLRGSEEWSYAQETVLAIHGQRTNDTISAALGVNPLPSPDIYRSYLNRDRLSQEYILAHTHRLKEAWQTYRDALASPYPAY